MKNMNKLIILFVMMLSLCGNTWAQEQVTVKGRVTDTKGEAMIGGKHLRGRCTGIGNHH